MIDCGRDCRSSCLQGMGLITAHLGFEGGICHLIALVPVHCFLITFAIFGYYHKEISTYRIKL